MPSWMMKLFNPCCTLRLLSNGIYVSTLLCPCQEKTFLHSLLPGSFLEGREGGFFFSSVFFLFFYVFSPQFASWIFPGGDLAGREGDFCFSSVLFFFVLFVLFSFSPLWQFASWIFAGGIWQAQREREIWEESGSNKSKCTSNNFFCSHIFLLFRRIDF